MLERAARQEITEILAETDLARKLDRAGALTAAADRLALAESADDERAEPVATITPPGRPGHWTVLPSHAITERPSLRSDRGRYLLVHSVGNIELSAVELALMTAADFGGQPLAFYRDWLRVAGEEVQHARLVIQRLRAMGGELGDAPVHLGLWETAVQYRTLVDRLAVVPRILEARGLDVSARLREQLHGAGDSESANLLERIYRDEIGHVETGSRWFREVCRAEGQDPEQCFIERYRAFSRGRGGRGAALDEAGRLQAGFTARELAVLSGQT